MIQMHSKNEIISDDVLRKLIPDEGNCSFSFPSFSHCIGRKRLLGEYYGKALSEALDAKDDVATAHMTELSILLRSFVVLDDHLKDTPCEDAKREYIANWTKNISVRCQDIINLYSKNQNLWKHYLELYETAYQCYDYSNPFESTMQKCSFLFLPLELDCYKADYSRKILVKDFVRSFLFSLQLLDDFHDMEEDLLSPRNHNLFVSLVDEKTAGWLIDHRCKIVLSLFEYIKRNLKYLRVEMPDQWILSRFCDNSIQWIEDLEEQFGEAPIASLFYGKFNNYRFDLDFFKKQMLSKINSPTFDVSIVSAESMHSHIGV